MKAFSRKPASPAFTLIELLIVVAIIAILAAIAVPNFLEAQVRAKVSRLQADMRSIRTGLETYRVDNNHYPETDLRADLYPLGQGMDRLTTPISYMTSVPKSPFKEDAIGGNATRRAIKNVQYLYVRAATAKDTTGADHSETPDASPNDGIDDNYQKDRVAYLSLGSSLAANAKYMKGGFWELKSVGPDNFDNFTVNPSPYDPTNGTVSAGDVVIFSDTQGLAKGPQ